MYNKCDACGRQIENLEECRLVSNDHEIKTYCIGCFEKRESVVRVR